MILVLWQRIKTKHTNEAKKKIRTHCTDYKIRFSSYSIANSWFGWSLLRFSFQWFFVSSIHFHLLGGSFEIFVSMYSMTQNPHRFFTWRFSSVSNLEAIEGEREKQNEKKKQKCMRIFHSKSISMYPWYKFNQTASFYAFWNCLVRCFFLLPYVVEAAALFNRRWQTIFQNQTVFSLVFCFYFDLFVAVILKIYAMYVFKPFNERFEQTTIANGHGDTKQMSK